MPQDRELDQVDGRMSLTDEALRVFAESLERQNQMTDELIRENQQLKKNQEIPIDLADLLRRAYNAGAQAQYDEIPSTVDVDIDEWAGNIEIRGTVEHELYIDEVMMGTNETEKADRLMSEVIADAEADKKRAEAVAKKEAEDREKVANAMSTEEQTS